jgi:hypothetical protein
MPRPLLLKMIHEPEPGPGRWHRFALPSMYGLAGRGAGKGYGGRDRRGRIVRSSERKEFTSGLAEVRTAFHTDMNAAQKNPDPRDLRYLQYVTARLKDPSQEEIAHKLGFGSPKALYQRLRGDGYPVCAECGETPVTGEHCLPPRKRAPAKGTGGTVALPPASGGSRPVRGSPRAFPGGHHPPAPS